MSAKVWAACCCMPGMTCWKVTLVKPGVECPSRSLTTFAGTPTFSRMVAWVWRKSWLCRRRHKHDLRHSYAALLIAERAHPRAIMERLGHSTITVTLDTYGHLFPSIEASLDDALDLAIRREP